MNRIVNTINGRLSLREPQRRSLEILARVTEIAPPTKEADASAALARIRSEYPTVTDFERDFPSLCFALATGVGKTRLMGAFIAYMYLTGRSRHFFVLAPNLTIYNKLIADFTPGSRKYVFQGLSEFVTAPPVVITGDNYETGIGVRSEARLQVPMYRPGGEDAVHINVFNISKINSDVRASQKGNKPPRIKRLAEYIGESYFDYLSKLPDLVLLMDESHRYRADAGTRAINDLKPILGLELTATPFTESTRGPVAFKNVAYSYSLAQAIVDGFVKEPAVATRKDFRAEGLSESKIERIKLEDGVRLHEQVRTDLKLYADQSKRPLVKPFMLVIARDTAHAGALVQIFKSPDFFGGDYANKVIEVHSAQQGEEKEETVNSLLAVEDPNEPTEIVIHVNMLKEGWDVTNLYTIVPLRAAKARTLIEQSIGRGLRLPYGKRVGVKAVDRLTIVAHDNFQEIVDEANRGDSIIRKIEVIELDPSGAPPAPRPVAVTSILEDVLSGGRPLPGPMGAGAPAGPRGPSSPTATSASPARPSQFHTAAGQAVARAVMEAVGSREGHRSSADLLKPEVQAKIVEEVKRALPAQEALPLPQLLPSLAELVHDVTTAYVALSIDIPTVVVVPTGTVTTGFHDFELDTSVGFHLRPVQEDILIQHLRTNDQEELTVRGAVDVEQRLEDYIVRALVDYDDVDYDTVADLLYKLAGQLVRYYRSYLKGDAEVRNVLLYFQAKIGRLVHNQMEAHAWKQAAGYEVKVTRGFRKLTSTTIASVPGEEPRNFREPLESKRDIRRLTFRGFQKCLYPLQKFDSDPERRFSVVLENDVTVWKWVKPGRGVIPIHLPGGEQYEPDFVVETEGSRFLVEIKRADHTDGKNEEVEAKARAAALWCQHASAHTKDTDGKPWRYLIIPDSAVRENWSLIGLVREFERKE